jgi:hypothetical protein
MADKYSHKPTKKKKAQPRKPAAALETTPYQSAAPAEVTPAPVPAAVVRLEKPTAVAPNLAAELKRVGVLGGILLVVLVAASFVVS